MGGRGGREVVYLVCMEDREWRKVEYIQHGRHEYLYVYKYISI